MKNQKARSRKNFLPTLIATTLMWGLVGGIIYFIEPEVFGAIPLIFVLIFLATLFTSSLVFGNRRRGLIVSISLIAFLFLRYFSIGNALNFLLIAGLAVSAELYLAKR